MTFKELAQYFEKIEATSSRLSITHLLAELFKKLDAEEIAKTVYLIQGRVGPQFEKTDFGIAERLMIKASCLALSVERRFLEKKFGEAGDLGKTVEECKKQFSSLEESDFSISEVFENLRRLAGSSGTGSQELKLSILADLIRRVDPLSARYIVRIPLAVMRMGFSDMTILDGLSWMIKGDKSLRPQIEKAYHVRPDLGFIAKTIKEKGVKELEKTQPKIFTPIIMMRAERLSSGKEIVEKIGRCAIQSKFDGFRLQVHYKNSKLKIQNEKEVKLYSRSLENVTYMYPDIVEAVKKEVRADEVIFEGEAIGFDPKTGGFLPFQETVQRKRKYNITEKSKEVPLKLFVFELLYLNGINYLSACYEKRRQQLMKVIKNDSGSVKNTILIAEEKLIDDDKKIDLLFDDAVSKGLEGIIAKKLDGIYQPGARGWNWVKFKKSYSSKIKDTIDCLVMGYDYGRGKRTSFGIGAFLVGVLDEQKDQFVTVAKIGTGLTDEEWRQLKVESSKFKVKEKPNNYNVDKMMECDVWVAPKIVVEIKADEITRSPVHTARLALRFPRLERFRHDKKPDDSTALSEIESVFKKQ